jgi:hypothetical protein
VRAVIETTMVLGNDSWPIELTLVRRDLMGFRMLVGRQALRRRVVVNPARSFLAGPPAVVLATAPGGPPATPALGAPP